MFLFFDMLLTRIRFLLAKVQLDEINGSKGNERKALRALPRSPDEAYQKILRRLGNQNTITKKSAFRTLSWILYARRPLQMQELLAAVQVDQGEPSDESAADIVDHCQGFVSHDKASDILRFVHGTVKTFLEEHIKSESESGIGRYVLSHRDLAKTCLKCLESDVFDTPCSDKKALEERLDRCKFTQYAVLLWRVHITGKAEHDPEIQKAVGYVFGPEIKRKTILQMENYVKSTWGNTETPTRTRLIHVLAANGLTTICRRFTKEPEMRRGR